MRKVCGVGMDGMASIASAVPVRLGLAWGRSWTGWTGSGQPVDFERGPVARAREPPSRALSLQANELVAPQLMEIQQL